jgi:hypothetical protein
VIFSIIALAICTLVAPFGALFLFKRYVESKQAEIEARVEDAIHVWIDKTPDGKSSKLAEAAEALGTVIGQGAARALMTSFAQAKGAEGIVANTVADGLQVQQNPLLALMTNTRRGKGAAVERLVGLLGSMFNQGGGGPKNGGHSDTPRQGSFSL